MSDEILDPIPPRQGSAISWSGAILGLIFGMVLGVVYSTQIDPVVVRNSSVSDLRAADKQTYIMAAALEYGAENDLQQVALRLLNVEPNENPFDISASMACELIRTGQISDVNAIEVIRILRSIYEPQGVAAQCDVQAFNTAVPITISAPTPTLTFTPSITPVASKTPTQAIAALPLGSPIPTSTPALQTGFQEFFVETYCDPNNSGLIEIYVRDFTGAALAGIPIEVLDQNRMRYVFYSGLKPERGEDYADYVMAVGQSYRVGIQGETLLSRNLEAVACDDAGTLIGYRVVLQRIRPEEG